MRQKYEIVRDDDNKRLIIREFAELDKDVMSLLCEETYDKKSIKSAMTLGRDALERVFDLTRYLQHTDALFARVFPA